MNEYRRRLPHIHGEGVAIFLTWRLHGTVAACARDALLTAGQAFVAEDRLLDRDRRGAQWLKDSRVAGAVETAILRGESEREFYKLHAWVIMPNHVHLLITPEVQLPQITRWLKGSTAREANRILSRTGKPFWRDESFDRWIRNGDEFRRTIRYIEFNPVSAGLCDSVEDWHWSSAGQRAGENACLTSIPSGPASTAESAAAHRPT
jgi:REP element-mobilizing transposase RayT